MDCPSCGDDGIKKEITLKGFMNKKKVVTYYCPLCHFENSHEFELSREDFELEKRKKDVLIQLLQAKARRKKDG